MKKIGIISKTGHTEPLKILKELLPWLRKKGCDVYVDNDTASALHIEGYQRSQIPAMADFVVVLGGDGTMLSVARLIGEKGIPILGVNIGGLGFLTTVHKEDIFEILEKVIGGQCSVEERMMLTACVLRHSECIAEYLVVNDVVVNKGALARIIDLETSGACVPGYGAGDLRTRTGNATRGCRAWASAAGTVGEDATRSFRFPDSTQPGI